LTLDDVATFDRSVVIKKIHAANSLFIVTTASQLIDALTDLTFTRDGESVELVPDYDGDLWRRSNELAGLTGLTATAEEINAAAEFVDGLPANSAAEHEYLAQVIDLSSGTSDFTTENAAFIVKVGNMVSFSWETNAHANAATASSASGIIPAAYRPAVTAYSARFSVVANNGTSNVAVGSTGSVTVGHRDLAGEAQNNTQILPGSMTWYVASS
jgi:plastocyanin